jgi:hypothetical protein
MSKPSTVAQIMWNTKMRGKGKKINREFGFLSFSTPNEAATAIRWMHGAVIEGLTKDSDGLTVQYEAQGTSGKGAAAQAHAAAAALGAHAGLLQQQLQLQQHLQAQALAHRRQQQQQQQQPAAGLSLSGSLPPASLVGLQALPRQHDGRVPPPQQQQAAMAAAAQQLMAAAAAAAAAPTSAAPTLI